MRISLSVFAAALLFVAGCGGPSLAGEWNVTGDKMPPGGTAKVTFTSNTYKMNIEGGQGGMVVKVAMDGTYTLKGEEMTMTLSNVSIDDSTIPAAFKAMIDPAKKELESSKGKPTTGSIKIDGDTATFTGKDASGNPASLTFTRIKK